MQAKIDAELNKTLAEMERSMMSREGDNVVHNTVLPSHGYSDEQVLKFLEGYVYSAAKLYMYESRC